MGTAQCPGNQQTVGTLSADGRWHFKFVPEVCADCPLRARCCTGQGGRSLTLGAHYAELEAARLRQQTETFKEEYRQHHGGIEGCLSALVRGQGLRVNRYTKRAASETTCGRYLWLPLSTFAVVAALCLPICPIAWK
jgi:hypothetical protein